MSQELHAFNYPIHVRYGECGPDGLVRLPSVANWLQEAAGFSAAQLGISNDVLLPSRLTWILTRTCFRIFRLPAMEEPLTVTTWPSLRQRLATRGYRVTDGEGAALIEAIGEWAVMDLNSRRLAAYPDAVLQAYPEDLSPALAFPRRALPRLREVEKECLIMTRIDDLDINGHVNNSIYMGFLLEPLAGTGGRTLAMADVQFRAETFPGETLVSRVSQATEKDGEWQRLHSIVRVAPATGEETEVCRGETHWH